MHGTNIHSECSALSQLRMQVSEYVADVWSKTKARAFAERSSFQESRRTKATICPTTSTSESGWASLLSSEPHVDCRMAFPSFKAKLPQKYDPSRRSSR